MNALELRPVSGRIGTEVIDPKLEDLLTDDDVRANCTGRCSSTA